MNNVYTETYINKLISKRKRAFAVSICAMTAATILDVGLLFFSNEHNRILMIVLLSLIFIVAGWLTIYFVIEGIIKTKNKQKEIESLTNSKTANDIAGTVTDIGDEVTLNKTMRCLEIMLKLDYKNVKTLYLDVELAQEVALNKGDAVNLKVVKNYIIGYEIIKHEEE